MFRHFLLFLLFKTANGQTNVKRPQDPSCPYPLCSCCLDTVQCSERGNCGAQCKDGYFGKKCLNTCPDNCVRCKDPDNPTDKYSLWGVANCTECKDGYFSTAEYFQCQFNCPDECQTCISDTHCISCKAGYRLFNGQCTICKTGCASCTSYNDCSVCEDGYYNSGGETGTLNCVECSTGCRNRCDKESGACVCSSGCSNQCDKTTGTCTCKAGYTGSRCESCTGGWYLSGASCRQCQSTCATCTSTAYACTTCFTGYFLDGNTCQPCRTGCTQCSSDTYCFNCVTGHYSPSIGCPACSTGCEGRCDQTSGRCSCKPGFDGEKCDRCSPNFQSFPKCDQCITGYQGESCDQNCPENCKHTVCERYGGKCTHGCLGKFFGSNCNKEETCIAGLYGDDCSLTCPRNCLRDCDRINGTCYSCINGYHGDDCTIRDSEGLSFAVGIALGIGVAAVVVLVIAVILLVYRRRLNARQLTGDPSYQRNPVYVNDDVTSPASITFSDGDKNIQTYKKDTKQKHRLTNIQNMDDGLGEGALQEESPQMVASRYETLGNHEDENNTYARVEECQREGGN